MLNACTLDSQARWHIFHNLNELSQFDVNMKYDEHDSASSSSSTGHINLFEPMGGSSAGSRSYSRINNQVKRKYYARMEPGLIDKSADGEQSESNTFQDLCLVGYSCNLYKDDLTALKLEDKNYLIPWNGDQDLLIDRYDCRGYLYDLDPYDADRLTDDKRHPKYSSEEIEMERLCDLERYKDLVDDHLNHKLDTSNTSRTGAAIGFVYSESDPKTETQVEEKLVNESVANERIFEPPESLQLPVGMLIPETIRMNQIIIKTAGFVAKSGLQMEILLKAKQASNSQFDFLNYENHLNPYYKHVQQLIRDKKIDPAEFLIEPEVKKEEKVEEEATDEDDDSEDTPYLHPLLFKAVAVAEKKPAPIEETPAPIETEEPTVRTEEPESIEEPEDETIKLLVEKMVEYVYKNGPEFEDNIRSKNDERFSFLNEDNKYFQYYRSRLRLRQEQVNELTNNSSSDSEEKRPKRDRKRSTSRSSSESDSPRSRRKRRSSESSSHSDSDSSSSSDRVKKKRKRSGSSRHKKKKSSRKKSSSRRHKESSSKKKHRDKSRERNKK